MAVTPVLVNLGGPGPVATGPGPLGHTCARYRAFEGRPHGPVMASV